MKYLSLLLLLPSALLAGDDPELAERLAYHQEKSLKLSVEQDELAADVQQLTIEQTDPNVIKLLRAVEEAMDDASGLLYEKETGGETIAAETDVIEKINEAAKEKQKSSSGGCQASSAMMDMLQRMLGKGPGSPGPGEGQQPGSKPGDKPGQGQTGESDTGNTDPNGPSGGSVEARTVPKGSGTAGKTLPAEFQSALEGYNRGAEKFTR